MEEQADTALSADQAARQAPAGQAAGEKDATPRLGSSFYDFHMLLYRAFHAQRNLLLPYINRIGLGSGQPKILSYLAVHGSCAQRELADFYEIDPAAVSRMLDALQRGGFITVARSDVDRRSKVLTLTPAGYAAVDAWDAATKEEERAMLAGFSAQEVAQFADFLRRAHGNLREYRVQLDNGATGEGPAPSREAGTAGATQSGADSFDASPAAPAAVTQAELPTSGPPQNATAPPGRPATVLSTPASRDAGAPRSGEKERC